RPRPGCERRWAGRGRPRPDVGEARAPPPGPRAPPARDLVWRAPAGAAPHRVVDALDLVQRLAVRERERRTDGDLRGAEVGEEAVLVQDRGAVPAPGTVELRDDVRAVLEAHVVDAVLEADERRAVARGLEAARLDRAQHPVRREAEEEVGHRGRV